MKAGARSISTKPEVTAIPTTGPAAAVGAMAYLAVVAYPGRDEWEKRTAFVDAFKALLSKDAIKRGCPRTKIRADLRAMRNKAIDGTIRKGVRRITHWRLPSAEVANEMLLWSTKNIGKMFAAGILEGIRRDCGDAVAAKVKIDRIVKPSSKLTHTIGRVVLARGSKKEWESLVADWLNSKERVRDFSKLGWKTTRPVLPLAQALFGVCLERDGFDPVDLVVRPDWLPAALRQSELLAQVWSRGLVAQYKIDASELVKLTPEK